MSTSSSPTKFLTLADYLVNFPFDTIRPGQRKVLQEICDAFNAGFTTIILQAPTGFGKSPLAVAVVRTLGTSYICSATKDLQAQYVNDFPFIKEVKGRRNFPCLTKDELGCIRGSIDYRYIFSSIVCNVYCICIRINDYRIRERYPCGKRIPSYRDICYNLISIAVYYSDTI
jgi:Rad3-related DNA helicase